MIVLILTSDGCMHGVVLCTVWDLPGYLHCSVELITSGVSWVELEGEKEIRGKEGGREGVSRLICSNHHRRLRGTIR